MKIGQKYGLVPDCMFGLISGGFPEWPADLQAATRWHSRRHNHPGFSFMLDATSAYDTVSHRSLSTACTLYGVPPDVSSWPTSAARAKADIVVAAAWSGRGKGLLAGRRLGLHDVSGGPATVFQLLDVETSMGAAMNLKLEA